LCFVDRGVGVVWKQNISVGPELGCRTESGKSLFVDLNHVPHMAAIEMCQNVRSIIIFRFRSKVQPAQYEQERLSERVASCVYMGEYT
jgi:hypothetical protein